VVAYDNIDTVDTSGDGQLSIFHITSHVRENLSFEAKTGNDLTVSPRLLGTRRTRQLDVLDTELVQSLAVEQTSLAYHNIGECPLTKSEST